MHNIFNMKSDNRGLGQLISVDIQSLNYLTRCLIPWNATYTQNIDTI